MRIYLSSLVVNLNNLRRDSVDGWATISYPCLLTRIREYIPLQKQAQPKASRGIAVLSVGYSGPIKLRTLLWLISQGSFWVWAQQCNERQRTIVTASLIDWAHTST